MNRRRPDPGTLLMHDDDTIIVIDPQWTDAQILEHHPDGVTSVPSENIDRCIWRLHTREQIEAEGMGYEFDQYWSPDGWGKTSINVAVISS